MSVTNRFGYFHSQLRDRWRNKDGLFDAKLCMLNEQDWTTMGEI